LDAGDEGFTASMAPFIGRPSPELARQDLEDDKSAKGTGNRVQQAAGLSNRMTAKKPGWIMRLFA
jgi:hypothetical protein